MSYTYPSSLDSLALEHIDQQPSQVNDEAAAADLALWTNAKFTYDTTPGQGILDDKSSTAFDLDKTMYEQLVQYLDLDLNSAQPQPQPPTQHTHPLSHPDSLGLDSTTTTYKAITMTRQQPPTLLPKPESHSNTENLFLLSTPANTQHPGNDSILNDNGKRTAPMDDKAHADDDKRKRNTAASARFRVKKKQKEQAMAQTVRDMTEKTDKLQNRVHELEIEIKWLRGLLLEKNASK